MAENPLAPVVAAAAVDGAPILGAAGAGAPPPPAVAEDPIHGVLRTCGVAAQASRMTFINIEGLDSLAAFAMMSGDTDVTEMVEAYGFQANCCRESHSRNNSNQKNPRFGPLG